MSETREIFRLIFFTAPGLFASSFLTVLIVLLSIGADPRRSLEIALLTSMSMLCGFFLGRERR